MKRHLALAAVLVSLLAGISAGLYALHHVFAAERADAEEAVAARRRALDAFAARAFESALARRLADVRPRIDAAEADPLAPVEGLYRRRGDRTTVPAAAEHRAASGAGYLYDALRDPQQRLAGSGVGYADIRYALRDAVVDALDAGDPARIEEAVRQFLAHRAAHRIRYERDIASVLAVLGLVDAAAGLDPALLRAVLHDGIGEGPQRVEGLQRTLLRRRGALDAAAFDRFADEIERLSRRGQVPRAAFARARTLPPRPAVPVHLVAPALFDDGRWYVAPTADGVDGVRVDPHAERAAIEQTMRGGGLLTDDERLTFDPAAPVPVAVASPAWTTAPARARDTWRLKLTLTWLCAALALAAAALVLLDLRRRRRFIELKSDFIAAVSHELRTPLAAIRLMAETLERRLADVPRARDYPARIVREADHLGFLVENLLSYTRIDKGRWVARPQPVALADLVARVRERLDTAFDGITIDWHLDGIGGTGAITLHADPALVELLLTNLLRNAIQHHGGDAIRLTIEGTTDATSHAIRVTDDGPGINPEHHRHIFEPFFRAPTAQSRGSGLGLALCRRIMTLHRGALALVRTGPDGTTFRATFPRVSPS